LVADDGTVFYTTNNPELLMGQQLQAITQDANDYFLEHSSYPPVSKLSTYQNIYTSAVEKPILKRTEFLASNSDELGRKIEDWKHNLSEPQEQAQAGTVKCFELLASYPKGQVEIFAARSSNHQKPQIIFSYNGSVFDRKNSTLISPDAMQIRWRRFWIVIDKLSSPEAFCLRHASIVFFFLLSTLVIASYGFLRLRGQSRSIRFAVLFVSLMMLAIYAAGESLP
jgi:hypothetical protein